MTAAWVRRLAALGLLLVLSACGAAPRSGSNGASRTSPGEPRYTVASYQVNGVWYYPKVDYGYDETGTASWYGPQFDGRPTADGEVFDMNEVSAAHKTLPLPSVVEVTNLENGRALQMRVNDRGPFVGDRLIDVSRRAAQLLGFETAGTASVRVRILKDESIAVAEAVMHGEPGPVVAAAAPSPARTLPPVRLAALPLPPQAPAAAPPGPAALPHARLAAARPQPLLPPLTGAQAAPPTAIPSAAAHFLPTPAPKPEPIRLAAAPPPRPAPAAALSPRSFADRIEAALIPAANAAAYEPVRLPPALPRAPSTFGHKGRIFIQAGAFAQRDNAERVQARIARYGAVEVKALSVNGAALYRVRLGPLSSIGAANALLGRVIESGCAGARVVAD